MFCLCKWGKTTVGFLTEPVELSEDSSLLDYLSTAIRSSGPNEISNPKYLIFTRFLLRSKTPECFFKNRALLNGALNGKPLPSLSSLRTLNTKPTAKPKLTAKPKEKKKKNQSWRLKKGQDFLLSTTWGGGGKFWGFKRESAGKATNFVNFVFYAILYFMLFYFCANML